MTDILSEICALKREHIVRKKRERGESALLSDAVSMPPARGFENALRARADKQQFALIAEIKKASPSKGVIRANFEPKRLAEAYTEGGAACLSVLTDIPYFQGNDSYIEEVRAVCPLPVLRKDFMLEPYQIIESRVLGADCILLIMAALSDAQAKELDAAAKSLGLDVLVEVHDAHEMERALHHLAPTLLGINNRDLKTLNVDIDTSRRLAPMIPENVLKVAESGVAEHDDLTRLSERGIYTFLVGESLMRQPDVKAATAKLLEG